MDGRPFRIGKNRPQRNVHGASRISSHSQYNQSESDVLIVGAGHAGLAVAAQLKTLGVGYTLIDKFQRLGDNWRNRYKGLVTHDPTCFSHLPYLPFPANAPDFLSADEVADFLEVYDKALSLDTSTDSSVDASSSQYDEPTRTWHVVIEKGGHRQHHSFKKIVLACGWASGIPYIPPIDGASTTKATLMHSSQIKDFASWNGRKALVVGAGVSGHDIAAHLHAAGAQVCMLQRSPVTVVSHQVHLVRHIRMGTLYGEEINVPPIELSDKLANAMPQPVMKQMAALGKDDVAKMDAELQQGLERVGFRTWWGRDGYGLHNALPRGGGWYINNGGSDLLIDGRVQLRHGSITSFEPNSKLVQFSEGDSTEYDLVVLCTGYKSSMGGYSEVVESILGAEWAPKVTARGVRDEEEELAGINGKDTGIPGVTIAMSNLGMMRFASKVIAMKIALELDGDG